MNGDQRATLESFLAFHLVSMRDLSCVSDTCKIPGNSAISASHHAAGVLVLQVRSIELNLQWTPVIKRRSPGLCGKRFSYRAVFPFLEQSSLSLSVILLVWLNLAVLIWLYLRLSATLTSVIELLIPKDHGGGK